VALKDLHPKHFRTISLSLDGPEEIHNTNRKFTDGSGSFSHVYRTAQHLAANKFPFGMKAVVTAENFDNLVERVTFFQHHFPGVSVGFEPVNEFGRCKQTGIKTPAADKFISAMTELIQNRELSAFSYSGVLGVHHIRLKFCGALKPTFGVHVDGNVVACVGDPLDNKQAKLFNYGKFDERNDNFIFEEAAIKRLRNLLVEQFEKCNTCFAKWNCAGDCASYRLFQETTHGTSSRCLINRALLREQLILRANERG